MADQLTGKTMTPPRLYGAQPSQTEFRDRWQKIAWRLGVLLLTGFFGDGSIQACADEERGNIQMAGALLDGLEVGRSSLRAGKCRIRGTETRSDLKSGLERVTSVDVSIAFNSDLSLWRFERADVLHDSTENEDGVESDSSPHPNTARHANRRAGKTGGLLCTTPDYDLFVSVSQSIVTVMHPGTVSGTSVRPFDVRCLGIYSFIDLSQGTSLERIMQHLRSAHPENVREVEDGVYEITSSVKSIRTVLWIDGNKGFSPVRFDISVLRQGKMVDCVRSQTTWTNVDDVWVPEFYVIETLGTSKKIRTELNCTWTHVNGNLSPTLFSVDGVSREFGAMVVNNTLAAPFLETPAHVVPSGVVPDEEIPLKRTGVFVLVAANCSIALLILLISAWSWNRERK